uniref:Neur_chan_LBD domain-containing protein n=1 Tax=Heterorhabditis bacteriophora TaxID=37862 RepID=A0A1I7WT62_HETBA
MNKASLQAFTSKEQLISDILQTTVDNVSMDIGEYTPNLQCNCTEILAKQWLLSIRVDNLKVYIIRWSPLSLIHNGSDHIQSDLVKRTDFKNVTTFFNILVELEKNYTIKLKENISDSPNHNREYKWTTKGVNHLVIWSLFYSLFLLMNCISCSIYSHQSRAHQRAVIKQWFCLFTLFEWPFLKLFHCDFRLLFCVNYYQTLYKRVTVYSSLSALMCPRRNLLPVIMSATVTLVKEPLMSAQIYINNIVLNRMHIKTKIAIPASLLLLMTVSIVSFGIQAFFKCKCYSH